MAKAELAITALVGFVIAPFLYVAAPGGVEPMFSAHEWQENALVAIAVAGMLIGFAWMVRIYRAEPEPDQRAWRYRERG